MLVVDSTAVKCARSVETTRRLKLTDAADCGYCRGHNRYFCGFCLHAIFALGVAPAPALLACQSATVRS